MLTSLYLRAGDAAHHGGHLAADHLQRIPADGPGQGGDAPARPHPPQGGILRRL